MGGGGGLGRDTSRCNTMSAGGGGWSDGFTLGEQGGEQGGETEGLTVGGWYGSGYGGVDAGCDGIKRRGSLEDARLELALKSPAYSQRKGSIVRLKRGLSVGGLGAGAGAKSVGAGEAGIGGGGGELGVCLVNEDRIRQRRRSHRPDIEKKVDSTWSASSG